MEFTQLDLFGGDTAVEVMREPDGDSEIVTQAIAKIEAEQTAAGNNPYVQIIGAFLLKHISVNPKAAGAILAEDKTIAKSLDAMRRVAETRKVGNCAVLTDEEGFAIVLEYFGIEWDPSKGRRRGGHVRS